MLELLERLRSLWGTSSGSDGEEADAPDDGLDGSRDRRPQSHLFHCPSCDVVYLAVDKDTCSSCGGALERLERSRVEDR